MVVYQLLIVAECVLAVTFTICFVWHLLQSQISVIDPDQRCVVMAAVSAAGEYGGNIK